MCVRRAFRERKKFRSRQSSLWTTAAPSLHPSPPTIPRGEGTRRYYTRETTLYIIRTTCIVHAVEALGNRPFPSAGPPYPTLRPRRNQSPDVRSTSAGGVCIYDNTCTHIIIIYYYDVDGRNWLLLGFLLKTSARGKGRPRPWPAAIVRWLLPHCFVGLACAAVVVYRGRL